MNHSCNVCFGEGGAGTFSDGKLQTQVKDKSGRIRKILEIFVEHGADSSILYDNKPHIGTDILTSVVKNMRNHMIILGAEVRFQTTFTGFIQKNGELCAVEVTRADGSKEVIETSVCVLAIGHSARDTFLRLHQLGLKMENKPFAVGLRIQHDQNVINES
ncbi:MAG TPA: FAD-dependent oxidoreductase, partial [Lachnospiraceae bacterium]|nr:FAD-dependent oxidoreductase [Lachnospiraceae bacterium]